MSFKFFITGPALHMEAEHFIGSFVGFTSSPQGDEQTGDQGAVKLDGQATLGEREKVFKSQDTFEPAEEEFNVPSESKNEGDEFGRQIQQIGHDQKSIIASGGAERLFTGDPGGTAAGHRIDMVNFNHPDRGGKLILFGLAS